MRAVVDVERFIKYLQETPKDVITDAIYDYRHRMQEGHMTTIPINRRRVESLLTLFKEIRVLTDEETAEDLFGKEIEANRLVKERRAKERLEANKQVLKDYRIK